jgi:hypothetical protein
LESTPPPTTETGDATPRPVCGGLRMPRRVFEDRKTTKHTLNLYEGDFEELQNAYRDLGASVVIRKLIRRHIEEEVNPKSGKRVKARIEL